MGGGPHEATLRSLGVEYEVLLRRHRWDVGALWKLADRIKAFEPDVLHSFGFMTSAMGLFLGRRLGIRVIDGSLRQAYLPCGWRGKVSQWVSRRCDAVVANSHAAIRAARVPGVKAKVIYNGFDTSRLVGLKRARRVSATTTRVIMVGRMHPDKDFMFFLRVARELIRLEPGGWDFVMVGDGPQRGMLVADARDLLECGVLKAPERGSEVLGEVLDSDVGVLFSSETHEEGCSNALLEFMACGLPVVCSVGGGNAEVVQHGNTGYLVARGDLGEAVSVLRKLGESATLRAKLGASGKAVVMERFSVARMVAETMAVYAQTLNHGSKGPNHTECL